MESILKGLFDFQRFARDKELQKVIDAVESNADGMVSEEYDSRDISLSINDLDMVSAAGCPFSAEDPFAKKNDASGSSEDDV